VQLVLLLLKWQTGSERQSATTKLNIEEHKMARTKHKRVSNTSIKHANHVSKFSKVFPGFFFLTLMVHNNGPVCPNEKLQAARAQRTAEGEGSPLL
jgi:hypothetical protein